MHHLIERKVKTIAYVSPVVEHWLKREIGQWFYREGWIRRLIVPLADALARSYISLLYVVHLPIVAEESSANRCLRILSVSALSWSYKCIYSVTNHRTNLIVDEEGVQWQIAGALGAYKICLNI